MKSYRYTRDLDGAPEGAVRKISADDAAPLLKSGAIVELADDVVESTAPPVPPIEPSAPVVSPAASEPTPSVTVDRPPARAKPVRHSN